MSTHSHFAHSHFRTRIKICGLTRAQDVDAAAAAGCDAVGFVLYEKSRRAVSLDRARELAARLPPFVTPVLLFVNAERDAVARACETLPHAVLQFHGDETPERCAELAGSHAWIRAARIPTADRAPSEAPEFDLIEYAARYAQAQAILLDALVEGFGGGGRGFDWSRLAQRPTGRALVIAGGLHAGNVADAIARARALATHLAVDVSSGVEAVDAVSGATLAGIKDAAKMRDFVAAVRQADLQQISGQP